MEDDDVGLIVREVARRHGRQSIEARLIRSGANSVYVVDDVVVRIARADVDVDRHLAIGSFLSDSGVPVPKPVASGELGGCLYSVWEYVRPDNSSVVNFLQFGAAIRLLHEIDVSRFDSFDLPLCDEADWLDLSQNLELARSAKVVPDEDIDLLEVQCQRLANWGDRCRAANRHVVCHGDVHPQNVLMRDGRTIIIDWDTICVGPPQWDHAALMTWAGRWGGRPMDYQDFANGYRETFQADPLARHLAEMRLLAPTINMIAKGANSQLHAKEARLRMRFWRKERDAPAWSPL